MPTVPSSTINPNDLSKLLSVVLKAVDDTSGGFELRAISNFSVQQMPSSIPGFDAIKVGEENKSPH